jgi:hypothetical protein
VWINKDTAFYVEEAPCSPNCGPGPATQPNGNNFTYDVIKQAEDPSRISQVVGAWPRPGQI